MELWKIVRGGSCLALLLTVAWGAEPHRPVYHFSPAKNWTNDPNGTVFYQGEYHLFYQYNPFGDTWGHMSWGHAVSRDLVHWEHLPVALAEENGTMIFSGSVVVDERNSSGFCTGGGSCLVAIYTGHTATRQSQQLAYSNDRGRTWTKFAGNPVIDLGMKDFRDPKVFWHEKNWAMVVALPKEHRVRFFRSADLKQWTALSDFGPAGATGGQWECPDLFPLKVVGEKNEVRWVLSVNLNPGAPFGGSGNQYFVGRFDGQTFIDENPGTTLWADYGRDFYASTSFSDIPARDGRRIWLAWFSNWDYARLEPTAPFRGMQTVPRELTLRRTAKGLRLAQTPVRELLRLRQAVVAMAKVSVEEANRRLRAFRGDAYEVEMELEGESGLRLRRGTSEGTLVGIEAQRQVFVDRTKSGHTAFHASFGGRVHGPPMSAGPVRLRVLVDRSSVEVFAGDGEVVLSERIFPLPGDEGLELFGGGRVRSLRVWRLRRN